MWVTLCFVNIVLKSKEKYELIFWSQGHFKVKLLGKKTYSAHTISTDPGIANVCLYK